MAKIVLVDFSPADRDRLVSEKYDVELQQTAWTSGTDEPLDLAGAGEIVFYQIGEGGGNGHAGLPAGAQEALLARVREGARVVCFVGGGEAARLTGIVGPIEGLQVEETPRPDAIVFNPRALFHVPFERFKPFIGKAYRLLPGPYADGIWEADSSANGKYEFLAKTGDGAPVAMIVHRGKGYLLLLPSFGPKNVEVVEYILKDKLPLTSGEGSEAPPDWIEADDYVFPELKALMAKRDEERRKLEDVLADYDRQIRELKTGGQEEFHRLLNGDGPALKKAVIGAFRYLGWGRVVDVDQYWKNTIRD